MNLKATESKFPKNYHYITNHLCPDCKKNLLTIGDIECFGICTKCYFKEVNNDRA